MKIGLIEALLNNCSDEVTSDTIEGTWKSTQRTSLKNAGSSDTRSNTPWKKAEFVVAYIKEGEKSFDLSDALNGWHNITDGFKNQYLIIEEEKDKWCVYDSSQKKIADEYNCEAFLKQQVLLRLQDNTRQRKSEFRAWLLQQSAQQGGCLYSPETVCSYVSAADKIHEHWGHMNAPWTCTDVQSMDEYLSNVYVLNGWQAFDALLDNGAAGKCLGKYREYLVSKSGCLAKHVSELNLPRQVVVYGAPGTGKSFGTDGHCEKHGVKNVFRTTFHPDSDYSTFVGSYKPTVRKSPRIVQDGTALKKPNYAADVDDELKVEERISYGFRPQAFMNAYVAAWKDLSKPVVLIVEEINRGNCAQIFGDLFQLLDRDDATGYSSYPITTDTDLAKWLADEEKDNEGNLLRFGKSGVADPGKPDCLNVEDWAKILKGEMLALPPNLYIWATMNTSDQSLFPIDSAFKRRWDWKYVPIREGKYKDGPKQGQKMNWKIRFSVPQPSHNGLAVPDKIYNFDWWGFLENINAKIFKTTESEDKKLGYFFVKPDGEDAQTHDGTISADRFVGKVVFYLWNDVFKDYGIESIFKNEQIEKKNDDEDGLAVAFERFFDKDGDKADPTVVKAFFKALECKSDEEIAAAKAGGGQAAV